MTKEQAQRILLRAFIATGELPDDIAAVLRALIALDGSKRTT